ncbi:uncharacterized protein RAG0_08395 [Rhynchosporium agropyri]|uniref:Uncharacterized protein n=1 Tax=Rhynchosporium agropyri TaxID=914238 RepID=A0A1E1KQM7_9HELO|nr:uncharacterized protein RAG0_08395 [Rhynchosporium agropyri]
MLQNVDGTNVDGYSGLFWIYIFTLASSADMHHALSPRFCNRLEFTALTLMNRESDLISLRMHVVRHFPLTSDMFWCERACLRFQLLECTKFMRLHFKPNTNNPTGVPESLHVRPPVNKTDRRLALSAIELLSDSLLFDARKQSGTLFRDVRYDGAKFDMYIPKARWLTLPCFILYKNSTYEQVRSVVSIRNRFSDVKLMLSLGGVPNTYS